MTLANLAAVELVAARFSTWERILAWPFGSVPLFLGAWESEVITLVWLLLFFSAAVALFSLGRSAIGRMVPSVRRRGGTVTLVLTLLPWLFWSASLGIPWLLQL